MTKPGPRPLPDNVRALKGFSDHKPPRAEIKPEPIAPKPPAWLSRQGRANWKFLAPELEKNALLTKRDREAFAMACEDAAIAQAALLEMRPKNEDTGKRPGDYQLLDTDPEHRGRLRRHPALIIYNQHRDGFRKWCDQFGLTPAGRASLAGGLPPVAAGAGSDDDEDDEFTPRSHRS